MEQKSISKSFVRLYNALTRSFRLPLNLRAILLLEERPLSPHELMELLVIEKSNLALLMNRQIKDGLVEKRSGIKDRRQIEYRLTAQGEKLASEKLAGIEKAFTNFLTIESQYDEAQDKIDSVLDIISFL